MFPLMFFTLLQTSMAAGVSFCQISPVLQCEGGSSRFNIESGRILQYSAFCLGLLVSQSVQKATVSLLVSQVLPLPLLNIALQAMRQTDVVSAV